MDFKIRAYWTEGPFVCSANVIVRGANRSSFPAGIGPDRAWGGTRHSAAWPRSDQALGKDLPSVEERYGRLSNVCIDHASLLALLEGLTTRSLQPRTKE